MISYTKTIPLENEGETRALGGAIAPHLRIGDIVTLRGDLGAGKTSLAKGLIGTLSGELDVPSPTYTLVQTYDTPMFDVWHFDLYRLEREAQIWDLGIEDAIGSGICLIEWPERIESLLSGDELNIKLEFNGESRTAKLSGLTKWGDRLASL